MVVGDSKKKGGTGALREQGIQLWCWLLASCLWFVRFSNAGVISGLDTEYSIWYVVSTADEVYKGQSKCSREKVLHSI
jgi:hypothetical protein